MTTKHNSVRRVIGLSLLISGPTIAYSQPVSLDDMVLNQVTAGAENNILEGSGGAVVGNSSTASIHSVGSVSVEGEAQSNAQSLNLVNSSESTVANGLNIWDGQILGGATFEADNADSNFMVNQTNEINQEQRRSAAVPEYARPEANTIEQLERTGSTSTQVNLDQTDTVTDLVTSDYTQSTTSNGTVDTIIVLQAGPDTEASVHGGKGLSVAGQLEAEFDAGEIEVGLSIGSGIAVNADAGAIDVGVNAETEVAVYGRIELPEFSVDVSGAGCAVMQGSCTSSGSTTETTIDVTDNSTASHVVSTEQGNSEYTESAITEYRSPFSLHNAQAEYIVVDDSSIDVSSEFSLVLSGSAQSNARAVNIVNSSGSAVANGVNISRTNAGDVSVQGGNIITLTQNNVISHSR